VTESPAGGLRGRRILVTGGSGFIGRRAVAELTSDGAQVRVVDLKLHPDPQVDIVVGDIADAAVLERAFDGGIDSVVHLAAVTSVLRSIERPEVTYQTNVAGTHRVLEAARQAGVTSLAFASTNAVTGPMEEPAITERARLRPLTPYGATKAAGEMLMSAYTAVYGVRCACLRLTNVYGLGMQAKDSIVARLMRAILTGGTFEIYGDGTQVRDYVNVSDVVAAIRLALLSEEWHGPVVIGTGKSLSVLEVVDEVRRVTGAELSVRHGPPKSGEMPAVIVDPSRAHAAGWTPQWGFSDGIEAVWQEWSAAAAAGADLSGPAGVVQPAAEGPAGAMAVPGSGR
jgi:UDP-glucose 4-epimerase